MTNPRTVVGALEVELAALAKRDAVLAVSALAAAARVLAARLDDDETSSAAAAALAKELREHVAAIRERAPAEEESTPVDDLAARAAQKLKRVK